MSGQTIDYAALAKQAGAVSSTPATSQASSGIDYAALAQQAGAISSTPAQPKLKPISPDDPFTEVDEKGNIYHKGKRIDPSVPFAPVPLVAGEAAAIAAGKSLPAVGKGVLQGLKGALPSAGATIEETTANVVKWAAQKGLPGGAGAWYLLHHFLGGEEK